MNFQAEALDGKDDENDFIDITFNVTVVTTSMRVASDQGQEKVAPFCYSLASMSIINYLFQLNFVANVQYDSWPLTLILREFTR